MAQKTKNDASSKKQAGARKLQLTLNNPKSKGYNHEKIRELLSKMKTVVYWCMGDEIGLETKTPHTHLFICSSSTLRFSTVKKAFPEAHIEATRGSVQDNINYVRKSGKWENDVKEDTKVAGTFEEWGSSPAESKQGKRSDLELLYSLIKDGETTAKILDLYPKFMIRIKDIERTRQIILGAKYSRTFRKLDVWYIWGKTGVGKTRKVMEKYNYDLYRVTNYKHPFDGYQGQAVLVLDEFRSSILIGDMLSILDGYPCNLSCRYADKVACYTKVYIISNDPLTKQYVDVQMNKPDTFEAFLRRINHVMEKFPNWVEEIEKDSQKIISLPSVIQHLDKTKDEKKEIVTEKQMSLSEVTE